MLMMRARVQGHHWVDHPAAAVMEARVPGQWVDRPAAVVMEAREQGRHWVDRPLNSRKQRQKIATELSVPASTLSKIIKDKQKYLQQYKTSKNPDMKHNRGPKLASVDTELLNWFAAIRFGKAGFIKSDGADDTLDDHNPKDHEEQEPLLARLFAEWNIDPSEYVSVDDDVATEEPATCASAPSTSTDTVDEEASDEEDNCGKGLERISTNSAHMM
ncbi:hypothetical protein ACOMHN_059580 [Nucella lapillus]